MQSTINGVLLKSMIISGANNLKNNKKMVDDLNVFPVPDGDTGTNMSMTVCAASKELLSCESESVSDVAKIAASASLRGARGNSGVIMSQLFRGLYKALEGHSEADSAMLAKAFKSAADTAYKAVMKPTEGTILTVARCASEACRKLAAETDDIEEILSGTVDAAKEALDKTPEMLPVLKQAGVVDAGGMGLLVILKGALSALRGEEITSEDTAETSSGSAAARQDIDTANIKFMYCTEFIINKRSANYSVTAFRGAISPIGDCMLVIDDTDIVKVHIHTNNPGFVLQEAVKIGDLTNIKIDNMKFQHNEIFTAPKEPAKPFGIVAVANGNGIEELLTDAGVDAIVKGGQSMNPGVEDIQKAVDEVNAETVFILPNNKNIILAAEQVDELTDKKAIVIPTKTIPQGIAAVLAFDPSADEKANEQAMLEASANVKTGSVTFASRDSEMDGVVIKKDDIMGLIEGKIDTVGSDITAVALDITEKMFDDSRSMISVYCGEDVTEEQCADIEKQLGEKYKNCDVLVYNGGQPIYYYIICVE